MQMRPRFGATLGLCLVAAGCLATACSTSAGPGIARSSPTLRASASSAPSPVLSGPQPVWLCRPGLRNDPCTQNLDYAAVAADGKSTLHRVSPAADPKVDCFYVYPTVSQQTTPNANLHIDPAETQTAVAQASAFSQDCNVWAPVYRQVTLRNILSATPAEVRLAYSSLAAAWKDYIAGDNKGRPFVLIGHSQGAALLIDLIRNQIDSDRALRDRLVSAIILGGNVTVPISKSAGGSFQHIPLCTSLHDTGCVIAYSSFLDPPPSYSLFGRPGTGVSLLSGQTQTKGMQVACVNPAAMSGGTGTLQPFFNTGSQPQVPWVTYVGLYSATCQSRGGATWLQVTPHRAAGDARPVVNQALGPLWGLHIYDMNIALGNLVAVLRAEIASFNGA